MRIVVLAIVMLFASVAFANPVAVVIRASGEVNRTGADQVTSSLSRRDDLFEGDQITTGPDSYVTLKFADKSVVDLGADSALAITRFRPNEESNEKVLLELLNGRLRNITGALAKNPEAFELRTAHASIGVRGTEFEVLMVSSVETQVQWHAGTVLVSSLEFQGQILELTQANPTATVTLGSPAVYIDGFATDPMGKFDLDLLSAVDAIPAPPLIPIAAAVIPAIVPLSAAGATPTLPAGSEETDQGPIEAFIALVRENRWDEARILADELQERYEGLPRFDLYFGILLMAEQSYDEAIFAFERVLIFNPEQHRARLELGRAYYLTGNYARARDALEQVLAADPPSNVRQNVRTLLNRVNEAEARSQTQTQFGGTVLAGWDTNANSGSNLEGELDANLLGLTELANASLPIDSAFVQWSVTTGLSKPNSQYSSSGFIFDFTNKTYLDASIDGSAALTASASLAGQTSRWRTQLPVSAQWSWLGGSSWQATIDANASQQYRIWGPLWVGVKIGTQANIALSEDNLSSAKDLAGLVFDAQERGRIHTFSSLYLQMMQSGQDDEYNEYRGLANRYQLNWPLPWNLQANLALEHEWREYKADDPFFTVNSVTTELKRRQDQVISSELQIGWAPTNWLTTQSRLTWEMVDSNINAYGRDQITVSQAVTVRF